MSKRNYFLSFLFLILIFVWRLAAFPQPHFVSGQKVKITSSLHQEPKTSGQTQNMTLGSLSVKTWRYPEFHYGDRLEIVGIIKNNALEFPEIKKLEKGGGVFSGIYAFRSQIESLYRLVLPEPQASLISGIVLGSKQDVPTDFYKALQQTGTLHIIVASGSNVAIVAGTFLSFFLTIFKRKLALVFTFLGIWFYVFLAGADVPVIRAGLMATFAYLAQGLGRKSDGWRGLFLAAFILLLINPLAFLDLGFQLSFAATAGILYFGPRFDTLLRRVPGKIRADLAQTLGAQTATFPILFFSFGQFNPFSPLANILVVTILPWIMKMGALVAILGLILKPIGQFLALFLWPLLTYFIKVVELFAKL
ncbi:MAG: ComEC/Rec2 family competence protein [bacterium]|nr:ComEC/Rec2 family competence protein [bacterium]